MTDNIPTGDNMPEGVTEPEATEDPVGRIAPPEPPEEEMIEDLSFDVEIPQEIWNEAQQDSAELIETEDAGLVELAMLMFARYDSCPPVTDPEDYWIWMAAPFRRRFQEMEQAYTEGTSNMRASHARSMKHEKANAAKREGFLTERVHKLEDGIERALTQLNLTSGVPVPSGVHIASCEEALKHLNEAL